jgi:hypothetical protein
MYNDTICRAYRKIWFSENFLVSNTEENLYHIYEGLVTYQNGGTAFMSADIPDQCADVRRGIIGYMLNTVFATYNPG